ncbi:MAG: HEAT repeat domain-containing protein [Planctomycetes bacterium]|nr:HEAT repeat domain-containing protein [Planctomycetota bacterium]
MDISKVPESLRHLVPYVERWTAIGHEEILARLESARSDETKMDDARRFAELFTPELQEQCDLWEDQEPITDSEETSAFYFATGVLDELDLLQADENWNTVERQSEELTKFGSYRLASGRMHSAKFLAEFGGEARSAIEPLRVALDDEDRRVRVWAHFALYKIDGGHQSHIESIRGYLHDADEEVRTEAAPALGEIGTDAGCAIPDLIELIEDSRQDEMTAVPIFMEALATIGADNSQAKEALQRATKSDSEWIRSEAESILESMADK